MSVQPGSNTRKCPQCGADNLVNTDNCWQCRYDFKKNQPHWGQQTACFGRGCNIGCGLFILFLVVAYLIGK